MLRPYGLVFQRIPRVLIGLETDLNMQVQRKYRKYYEQLNIRFEYLQKLLFAFKMKKPMLNKEKCSFSINQETWYISYQI